MSIVCCLIHEMRDSTRVWYSSHLESTSCGVRASAAGGTRDTEVPRGDPVPCCDATPGTGRRRRRILLAKSSMKIQLFSCRAVLWSHTQVTEQTSPPSEPLPQGTNPSPNPQVCPSRAYDGADPFSSLGDFGKGIVD